MIIQKKSLGQSREDIKGLENEKSFSLFHTYEWLNTLEKTLDLKANIYVLKTSKTVGFFPGFKKMGILFSPAFSSETAYGGIVCNDKYLEDAYSLLKKECEFFAVHPDKLKLKGVACEPKYTITTKLDSRNADEHFKRLKKGHRYNIKKAQKDNVLRIVEKYDDKTFSDYHHLLKKTYGYKGYSPLPKRFYEQIIGTYLKKDACRFLMAYKGRVPVGTICAIIFKDKLHYWTGGFLRDPEYRKLYPNDMLQWEIIKWGYQRKVHIYDMLGADIEGIRRFKLGFGGEIVEYTRLFSSKKLQFLAKLYKHAGKAKKMMRKN